MNLTYLKFIIVILVVVLIAGIIWYCHRRVQRKGLTKNPTWRQVEPQLILQYYQMTKDLLELFDRHGIEYFASGGTLLGIVRHKGMMPWDDDVDLFLPVAGETILNNEVQTELEALGYGLRHVSAHKSFYKVYPLNGQKIRDLPYRYPYVDLFIVSKQERDGKPVMAFKEQAAISTWGDQYFTTDELYPLKTYKFGEFTMKAAKNPKPYLDRFFGKDWTHIGKVGGYNHQLEQGQKGCSFELEKKHRVCAQPTGPLQDRT